MNKKNLVLFLRYSTLNDKNLLAYIKFLKLNFFQLLGSNTVRIVYSLHKSDIDLSTYRMLLWDASLKIRH